MAAQPEASHWLDRISFGDCRPIMRDMVSSGLRVNCVVTSPPYWGLRDYGANDQLGLEPSLESYLATQADIFDQVRDLLTDDGTLWLNIGDSYVSQRMGSPGESSSYNDGIEGGKRSHTQAFFVRYARRSWLRRKNLIGLPWHFAFALQRRGWILRDCIVWSKPNPLPESVKDRTTKSHEYLFMLTRNPRYYYDAEAIAEPRLTDLDKPVGGWAYGEGSHDTVDHNRPLEPNRDKQLEPDTKYSYTHTKPKASGRRRNRRSVWTLPTEPYRERHFATFPTTLAARCILAGCPPGGIVFDPYAGTGTVAAVAKGFGRHFAGCELNEDYRELIDNRLAAVAEGMEL